MEDIKFLELEQAQWKANMERHKQNQNDGAHRFAKGVATGIGLALKIFKRPSNTRMHVDAFCSCPKVCDSDGICNLKNARGECSYRLQ